MLWQLKYCQYKYYNQGEKDIVHLPTAAFEAEIAASTRAGEAEAAALNALLTLATDSEAPIADKMVRKVASAELIRAAWALATLWGDFILSMLAEATFCEGTGEGTAQASPLRLFFLRVVGGHPNCCPFVPSGCSKFPVDRH